MVHVACQREERPAGPRNWPEHGAEEASVSGSPEVACARAQEEARAAPARARQPRAARARRSSAPGLFLAVVTWLEGNGGIVGTTIADWLDALFGTARIGVPVVLARPRRAHDRPRLARRRQAVPHRPRPPLRRRPDAPRRGAGRGVRHRARRRLRPPARRDGHVHPRPLPLLGRRAPAHRRLARRDPAPLRRTSPATPPAPRAARSGRARPVPRRPALGSDPRPGLQRPCPAGAAGRRRGRPTPTWSATRRPHQPVLVDQLGRAAGRRGSTLETDDVAGAADASSTRPTSEHADYRLPDAGVLRRSRPHEGQPAKAAERTAEALLQALANFGIDATLVGQVVGPRVTRYELQLAPGTKVGKVAALKDDLAYALATTEIRILAPDPGQAGRRRRGAEPLPEHRHARRHLRRAPVEREPALGLARQGHLRRLGLGRPRPHAAHPHRRHDRLGEVRLHQHDALLHPPARDAGRRAHDPRRPEARRARPLRVDPAPAHAGRLEPEAGLRRARERPHRDGAPLRAHEPRSGAQPPGAEPRPAQARGGASSRTSSSSSTSSPT